MRVLLSWLREFVPVEAEPDELAARLTLAGLAVEELIRTGRDISGVVVGEVIAKRPHPNSDRLMLVRATDGSIERDIVCGANNYEPGDRVPMALPGARLPGGMEIAQRSVRGEVSDGMLCSATELRVADDHSGIMILDADAPLGKDVVDALQLDDVLLDIDVTGNRPDCLSVVGIAREIAVLYDLPFTVPVPQPAEAPARAEDLAAVEVADARGCPRYVARVIEGIRLGPSPWWIRRRLLAAGMRPISNVVDVTNLVMLERGQPLHAFDLETLAGARIVVRRPARGERMMRTLDGQERALVRDDLLICDAERPVALAGVMGGAETEVSDGTTRILLESAYFTPERIARTVRRLGMRSEASVRFEHGIDPAITADAATVAAALLEQVAGGTVARGAVEVSPKAVVPKPVRFRPARAQALIGAPVEPGESRAILERLGCAVNGTGKTWRVTPPTWRPDIAIEENLVEEIARLYGYERVPERMPEGARQGGLIATQARTRLVGSLLRGSGLSEAQTLTLLPPWVPDRLDLPQAHAWRLVARLSNPLSEEESVLRPSLLPGLLLAAQRNAARRVLPVRLYEVGRAFSPDGEQVAETPRVAFILAGPASSSWSESERGFDFFDVKGVLEALLAGLGLPEPVVEATEPLAPFHPGRTARVLIHGEQIGLLAELHPRAADALSLPEQVAVCEVDLLPLIGASPLRAPTAPPRFPAVRRDIALLVGRDDTAASVRTALAEAGGALLESVVLFDVYTGERIPEGTASLAFALSLRAPDRTLTDADADAVMTAIERVANERNWIIRA